MAANVEGVTLSHGSGAMVTNTAAGAVEAIPVPNTPTLQNEAVTAELAVVLLMLEETRGAEEQMRLNFQALTRMITGIRNEMRTLGTKKPEDEEDKDGSKIRNNV